ncbi:MAG: hypothetical protein ACKODX_23830, partial [Gemmata sp.]
MLVPAVAPWLALVALGLWRRGEKGRAAALLLLAALPVAYLAVYFQGYHRPAHHPPMSVNPVRVATVTGEVLAVSFGMGLSLVW